MFSLKGKTALVTGCKRGIGFAMAGDMVMPTWEGVTSTVSKRVGMGLNTFYIMLAIAVGAILFGEVSRFFK